MSNQYQHQHGWRWGVMGATLMILSACKYQSEDSSPAAPATPSTPAPSTPSVPAAPSAFGREASPQVSTSGPLTLERYSDTTSAAGGTSSSGQNALAHEESKP